MHVISVGDSTVEHLAAKEASLLEFSGFAQCFAAQRTVCLYQVALWWWWWRWWRRRRRRRWWWWCYFYFMFACDELFYFVLTCSCIIAWHCLVSLISPRWGAVVLPPGPAPTGLLTHQSYYIIMITSHKGVMIYHVEPVERGGERLLSGFWGFNLWQIMSMCCTAVFRNHIVVSCSFCRENIAYWRIFFIPVLIHLWSAVLISTGNIPLKSCINLNRITIFLFQGNIQTKKVKYCEQVQH